MRTSLIRALGTSIGGTVVAVGEAEAAGGAAFEHRDGAVVFEFSSKMLQEYVGECFHCREGVFVRCPFQILLCYLLFITEAKR